jgi:hypothetical protein
VRWRAPGRWLSQQAAEQNTSFTRPELQVLTAHLISLAPTGIGFLHIEQTKVGGDDMTTEPYRKPARRLRQICVSRALR